VLRYRCFDLHLIRAYAAAAPGLITQSINDKDLVTLQGSMRPEMTPANDRL
jgi:hypothetical protein